MDRTQYHNQLAQLEQVFHPNWDRNGFMRTAKVGDLTIIYEAVVMRARWMVKHADYGTIREWMDAEDMTSARRSALQWAQHWVSENVKLADPVLN